MRRRARRHGMTVIELVVVVALVGIMSVVVVPSFASFDRKPASRSATEAIDALVRLGRNTAVQQATAVSITVDPAGKRFWLEPLDTSALLALPDDARLISRARRVHIRIEPNGEATIDEALFVHDAHATMSVAVDR